jgi:mycothiol synthase
MTTEQPVHTVGRLSASEADQILALADAAAAADGVYPLSEDVVLRVRDAVAPAGAGVADASGGSAPVHLLVKTDDGLAGYSYLDPGDPEGPAGELVVHPGARRKATSKKSPPSRPSARPER